MHLARQSTQRLRQLLLGALICCGCAAHAAVVDELYTAIVERQTQEPDPRAAALSAAMAQVLVRVTGNRMAASAPELSPLLGNPEAFLDSFGNVSATQTLVRFLPNRVERELTAAGWPLWGAERPLSILWIAVTDQFGDQVILTAGDLPSVAPGNVPDGAPGNVPDGAPGNVPDGVSGDAPDVVPDGAPGNVPAAALYSAHMLEMLADIREEIEAVAQARGIPYILPEFATWEDMRRSFDEVWTYSFGGLSDISSAGEADSIVIGRVRESVIGTDVEWLLQSESERSSYPGAGVSDGIHWLADSYAQQYGSSGGPRPMTILVAGVGDFESYARVLSYLESVTMLSDVDVTSYSGSELRLRAVSRGDAAVLARTLGLDDVLRERGRPFGAGAAPGSFGATLDLIVVPERSVFGSFDSGQ